MAPVRKVMASILATFDLADVFAFGGLVVAGYGVWQIHQPSAFIVVGVTLFWLGVRSLKGTK